MKNLFKYLGVVVVGSFVVVSIIFVDDKIELANSDLLMLSVIMMV